MPTTVLLLLVVFASYCHLLSWRVIRLENHGECSQHFLCHVYAVVMCELI